MNADETPTPRPLVLIAIGNGWGVRNYVNTGILRDIRRFADVGVACPAALHGFFSTLLEDGEIDGLVLTRAHEPRRWKAVRRMKKGVLQAEHNISTARIRLQERGGSRGAWAAWSILWRAQRFISADWQRTALERLEQRHFSDYDTNAMRVPDLLIDTSPFEFAHQHLHRSLRRHGVRTVSAIMSWDNPSTKGCLPPGNDAILVWGENQRREIVSLYPEIDPETVRVVGVPQFDAYYETSTEGPTREQLFNSLGIAPQRRVILYATCAERLFPDEPQVVLDLANAVEFGRFGDDVHLLVRCHPNDDSRRYDAVKDLSRVTLQASSTEATRASKSENEAGQPNSRSWTPPQQEVATLAATLVHCNLCVNVASTMSLDAFAFDKPVVNVAYDGARERPLLQSVRRYYQFHHYRPLVQRRAVELASSKERLIEMVDTALSNPGLGSNRRKALLQDFCYRANTSTRDEIVSTIERLVIEPDETRSCVGDAWGGRSNFVSRSSTS